MATFKDKNTRPQVQPPMVDSIPAYLQRFPQWILWQFQWREDQQSWAKVPIDPHTYGNAKSDDPATWMSFQDCIQVYALNPSLVDGLGFVFTANDDLCGVDFDNCLASGQLEPSKQAWVDYLNSYTEESVTGTGLHVICRAVSGKGRKDRATDIELYDRGRYFAFSGRVWQNRSEIHWRQFQIEELKARVFPEPVKVEVKANSFYIGKTADELLRLAFASKNGDSIFRLWQGDITDYQGDDSAADLALCSKLAFWSGGSTQLLDEMFRGSRLYREKWDKRHSSDGQTYGQMTLDKALSTCQEFYRPGGNVYVGQVDVSGEQPLPAGSVKEVFSVDELRQDVYDLYQKGRTGGEFPGWDNLAKLYTVKRCQMTLVLGTPNVGKSPFVDNIMVNLALNKGWKFAVCSLENQYDEHLSMLLEIYTGEPFGRDSNKPRMSQETMERGLDWIHQHFYFIIPDEANCTIPHLIELLDDVPSVDGVVIDPWNEFEHRRPPAMTETEYTSMALTKMKRYAQRHDQHLWLVVHPTKLRKDEKGNYPVPNLYDASGSAHFRNKPEMGLVLWRDYLDPSSPLVVFVQKVKYRWCGKVGSCELYYDPANGRFNEYPVRFDAGRNYTEVERDDEEAFS